MLSRCCPPRSFLYYTPVLSIIIHVEKHPDRAFENMGITRKNLYETEKIVIRPFIDLLHCDKRLLDRAADL